MANGSFQAPTLWQFSVAYVEKALLGRILIDREIPEALCFLEPADFRDSLNRAIYVAMRALQAQGEDIDLARVLDQMRRDKTRNDLAFAGGLFYLYECMDLYPALGGGPIYAQRIVDLAGQRGVVE